MNDLKEISGVISLSTVETTRGEARKLLKLCEKNKESQSALAGCCIILLAAALDQSTSTILKDKAMNQVNAENDIFEETESGKLSKESLRTRFLSLPFILSEGKYDINRNSQYTKLIHDLISLRNQLAHVEELPLTIPNSKVKIAFNQNGETSNISCPVPQNPWTNITFKKAEKIQEAVDIYFKEVSGDFINGGKDDGEIISLIKV